MDGLKVKATIDHIKQTIIENGTPVVTNNQGTLELLAHSYSFTYNDKIDVQSIKQEMEIYYNEQGLDLTELQELEKDEYEHIEYVLTNKFEMFDEDLHSRRVLWTDDCCISMIHYLVRANVINCYVHFRSSDVNYKLFSDLYLIHKITRKLQERLDINYCSINIIADSCHIIAIKDVTTASSNLMKQFEDRGITH